MLINVQVGVKPGKCDCCGTPCRNSRMRVVVQRVTKASVTVDGQLISSIGRGICVLVGISRDDTQKDVDYMCRKLLALRVFETADGRRWAASVRDCALEVLCVSQFTLCCQLKGNKPDYRLAMSGEPAQQLYQTFLDKLRAHYQPDKVKDGLFAAYMQVSIHNDGPVTITLDSPSGEKPESGPGATPTSVDDDEPETTATDGKREVSAGQEKKATDDR